MYGRVLKRIREKVRRGHYMITTHADEEMDEDGLSIFDVESCILNGSILERQKDRETQEWKYVISGQSVDESNVWVVAKFGATGNLFILTLYAA